MDPFFFIPSQEQILVRQIAGCVPCSSRDRKKAAVVLLCVVLYNNCNISLVPSKRFIYKCHTPHKQLNNLFSCLFVFVYF